jgi:hypothetical protein
MNVNYGDRRRFDQNRHSPSRTLKSMLTGSQFLFYKKSFCSVQPSLVVLLQEQRPYGVMGSAMNDFVSENENALPAPPTVVVLSGAV